MTAHKLLTTGSCTCGWTYSEYEFDELHEGTNTDCTCIHPPASHEDVTGRCLQDNPTFGPCPCEYRRPANDDVPWVEVDQETAYGRTSRLSRSIRVF
jgi:hypothetical protein